MGKSVGKLKFWKGGILVKWVGALKRGGWAVTPLQTVAYFLFDISYADFPCFDYTPVWEQYSGMKMIQLLTVLAFFPAFFYLFQCSNYTSTVKFCKNLFTL